MKCPKKVMSKKRRERRSDTTKIQTKSKCIRIEKMFTTHIYDTLHKKYQKSCIYELLSWKKKGWKDSVRQPHMVWHASERDKGKRHIGSTRSSSPYTKNKEGGPTSYCFPQVTLPVNLLIAGHQSLAGQPPINSTSIRRPKWHRSRAPRVVSL